jgi:hypothetical protein
VAGGAVQTINHDICRILPDGKTKAVVVPIANVDGYMF